MKTIEEAIMKMDFGTTTSENQRKILIDIARASGVYTKTNIDIAQIISRPKADVRRILQSLEQRGLIIRQIFMGANGTVEKRVLSLHPNFIYRLSKACDEV